MTIKELINVVIEDEEPTDLLALGCFLAIAGALRSVEQGEPSTFDGECSSVLALMNQTNYQPTVEGLQKFMEECPAILSIEIPDQTLFDWANADEEEP